MNIARTTFALALAATLAGCGGGGEDFTNRPRIRVHWPALGRSLEASPYANSIRITFPNARLNPVATGSGIVFDDVVLEVNRPSDSETETEYAVPEAIKPGKTAMTIETFSQANQQGRQLQTASVSVLPDSQGFFPDFNLTYGSGAVKSVLLALSVPPGPPDFPTDIPTVYQGNTPFINIIYPGNNSYTGQFDNDIVWHIAFSENFSGDVTEGNPVRGADFLYAFQMKTIRPGIVTLQASIDGVFSDPVRFRVISRP